MSDSLHFNNSTRTQFSSSAWNQTLHNSLDLNIKESEITCINGVSHFHRRPIQCWFSEEEERASSSLNPSQKFMYEQSWIEPYSMIYFDNIMKKNCTEIKLPFLLTKYTFKSTDQIYESDLPFLERIEAEKIDVAAKFIMPSARKFDCPGEIVFDFVKVIKYKNGLIDTKIAHCFYPLGAVFRVRDEETFDPSKEISFWDFEIEEKQIEFRNLSRDDPFTADFYSSPFGSVLFSPNLRTKEVIDEVCKNAFGKYQVSNVLALHW